MRKEIMLYRGAVAAKEFFERIKIGWVVSLAKLAVSAILCVVRVP
jgi:hypothetical protein